MRSRFILFLMLLALVCLVLSPSQVAHATTTITHDSSGSNDCGSCSTLSWPMTVGSGANGILLVGVSLEGSSCHPFPICTANTVTYGASSLTLIGRNFEENAVSEIWFLQPPTAGTATVTVTVNGTADFMVAGSVSFFGVSGFHDFTPGQGQSTNPSVTVNANMGDVVFDCVVTFTGEGHYGSLVWNNPQSPQWEIGLGGEVSQFDGGGSYQPADPTVTNGWHATTPGNIADWVDVGLALSPVSAPPIPEYPLGLPLLAIFLIVGYAVIRRNTALRN